MSTSSDLSGWTAVGRSYQGGRRYRKITETVLRWYLELEDGIIQSDSGPVFDSRILNYRLDVERVLASFNPREQATILLIHREGLAHDDACRRCGIETERPDNFVADVEQRMGRAFAKHQLHQFLDYVGYLR